MNEIVSTTLLLTFCLGLAVSVDEKKNFLAIYGWLCAIALLLFFS